MLKRIIRADKGGDKYVTMQVLLLFICCLCPLVMESQVHVLLETANDFVELDELSQSDKKEISSITIVCDEYFELDLRDFSNLDTLTMNCIPEDDPVISFPDSLSFIALETWFSYALIPEVLGSLKHVRSIRVTTGLVIDNGFIQFLHDKGVVELQVIGWIKFKGSISWDSALYLERLFISVSRRNIQDVNSLIAHSPRLSHLFIKVLTYIKQHHLDELLAAVELQSFGVRYAKRSGRTPRFSSVNAKKLVLWRSDVELFQKTLYSEKLENLVLVDCRNGEILHSVYEGRPLETLVVETELNPRLQSARPLPVDLVQYEYHHYFFDNLMSIDVLRYWE